MGRVRAFGLALVSAAAVWLAVLNVRTQTVHAIDGSVIGLDPSIAVPTHFSGSDALGQALDTGRATPLSMDVADLDRDGIPDMVAGYSVNGVGAIAVFRGNIEAFQPHNPATLTAIAHHQPPSPFLPDAQAFSAPARPDFLGLGRFSASQTQVVLAARNGNAVYVLSRDDSGDWQTTQTLTVDGSISAMAASRIDPRQPWHQVFVSASGSQGTKLLVYSGSDSGLQLAASYSIPTAVTSFQFGSLDGNAVSDAAMIAGGQIFLLHGSEFPGSVNGGLEAVSLPYGVSQAALGHFVFDRLGRIQMAIVAADGSIHIVVHEAFDGRPLTASDIAERRRISHSHRPAAPAAARRVLPREHWREIETFGGMVSATALATARVFATHVTGYAAEDLMVLDPVSSTLSVIAHPNQRPDGTVPAASVFSRPEALRGMTAAVPQRVNTDGRPGVLLFRSDSPQVAVLHPHATFTYNVNRFDDPTPINPISNACNNVSGDCSLREAIIKANVTSAAGDINNIILLSGTYTLSLGPAGNTDASSGNLAINVSVNITGQGSTATAGANATIVDAALIDKVFSVNPLGNSGFNVTFTGLNIRNGKDPVSNNFIFNANFVNENPDGGGLDFDSGIDSAGSLSLSDVIVQSNATTDGDGGGIAIFNTGGTAPGTVSINNSQIISNNATESTTGGAGQGGGIWVGKGAVMSVVNTVIDSNIVGGSTGVGFGGGVFINGPGSPSPRQNTFTGGEIKSNDADSATPAGQGGGIWTGAGITVTGTVIASNHAGTNGGGIWTNALGETTTLSQINFQSNSVTAAGGTGGAIQVGDPGGFATTINLTYCRLYLNTAPTAPNISNLGDGSTVNALTDWWGQNSVTGNGGPGVTNTTPFIVLSNTASPNSIVINQTSTLTASFLQDNNNTPLSASNLTALIGLPLTFQNPVNGTLSNQQPSIQTSATGTATFTGTAIGIGTADAKVDNQTVTSNNITIGQGSTTTAVSSSSPNPSVFGQAVTITATVTPGVTGTITPSGTVTIKEGTATICTTSALSAGSASCSTSTLPVGSHTFTAVYAGDTNFTGSNGTAIVPQVVNKSDTSTGLTSSQNPSVFGQSVTFTATITAVAPGGGIPTGNVTFFDTGNVSLGTVSLNGSGVATLPLTTLTVGSHSITATYNGDSNFNISFNSLTGTPQVVNKGNTGTVVTSSANPATDTQIVTFTATVSPVSPAAGVPTGTVTFLDGGNPIGTGSLNGSGVATFPTSTLALGSHTITTTYPGDGNFNGSTGSLNTNPQVITAGAATHFIVTAPGTATAGTAFNFTVTALDAFNNTATGYTGTVHFTSSDGQATLPANSTLTNGVGTFSATLKTAGNQTITATDTVTGTINGTSNTIAVSPAAASHFSVSAPATASAGVAFALTVTALDPFNNTATSYAGTVHFSSTDGAAVLPANSTLTNGVGSFSATLKTTGNQTITATDTVTNTITGTSNTITVGAAAGTHLTVSAPSASTAGTAFNFTVTAFDQFNNVATGYTGTVHFTTSDGQASLPADSTLTNGTGTFSATLKTRGSQTITATDTVTNTITGTSNSITVSAAAATHFLVSAPGNASVGTAFSFTVTAQDQFNNTATSYTDTVHFTSSDGAAVLPVNSTLTNGVGSFSATLMTVGNQTITATDTVTNTITGTSGTIVVAAASGIHFSISAPASATAGTAFNFVITALNASNATVTGYTGTVHFTSSDGQATLPADSTLTNGTGTFSATLKTAGNQTITGTDTTTSSINGASNTITVGTASATHFSVSAPGAATSGTAFNFTVTAFDQFNNTVTGYTGTVHFTSTDGQATLPANTTLTNGTGTFSATLKTAGNQTITGTDTVTNTITGTSGAITVSSAASTHFTITAPASATAGTAFNVTVTAQDQFNNTVTGYTGTVHFTSTDGQAVLPANSTLTNGTGTFSATLKTGGAQSITGTDTVTAVTGTSNLIAVSSAPTTHFSVSAPAGVTAGVAFNFTVTALDQFNNTATGYTGTVHFTSTDGSATLPANSTLTSGVGTFSATLKTPGSQTITATDTVTATITGTSNGITLGSAVATHFTVSAPATATAGTAFNFTVTALDQFNNTATGYTGTVHFTSTDGSAVLPANSTLTNGTGTFSATLKTAGSRTVTATDTVTVTITGTSAAITVSATAGTHLSVSAPATATAGTAFNFTVTALDQFNNTVTGYTGTVHFTSSDGSAVLPANSTLTNGTGTFSATLKTSGNQTITATDTVTATITGTSASIVVSGSPATHLSVSAPTATTAGAALSVTVTALDQFNNTATGYAGTVHFSSSDSQAVLPANSTLTSGTGTFSVTLKSTGSQTIVATDTVTSSITGTATVNVTTSTSVHFTVSAPATATAGTAFNFTVTAVDQFNNMMPSYSGTVAFTSTDSKAVLPGNSNITGGTGTFSATLKTAGARTITATDTAHSSTQGTSGTITVAAGPVASLTVGAGSPQSAALGSLFSTPFSVILLDAFGNPVQGQTVTFTAPGSGASLTFSGGSTGSSDPLSSSMTASPDRRHILRPSPDVTSVTATAVSNSQGTASISGTANNFAGTYTVTATFGSYSASFFLTNAISSPTTLNALVTPAYLNLRYQQAAAGAAPNPAVASQLTITSAFTSSYTATTNATWLTVTPPSASTTAAITASANGAGMTPGIYSANIVFTFGDNSIVIVPVQLQVIGPALIKPDVTALSFTAQAGSTTNQSQSFYMRSAGADFAGTLTITDVSGNGGSWLTVTPASFSTPAQLQVTVNPTGLAPGVYVKNIVVTAPTTNSPLTITVTFTITAAAPTISVTSVVNAASFATGAAAPNTIVTAFGTFPSCTSNAQATVDGTATSVFYSSPTQISLLIPASVAGEATAQLQVSCAGLTAAAVPVPIVAVAPALFTVSQNGMGQADVVNQDASIDTPSPAGTVIQLYGTGFGVYNPAGADGLMRLAQTVTATVGGAPAQVLYAGEAPGNTLGLQQIDILVPAGATSGTTPALQLTIGGVNTQTALTLAIK